MPAVKPKLPSIAMNRRCILLFASIGMCCLVAVRFTRAEQAKEERATGDEIKLKLKDLKFSPPATVADPNQALCLRRRWGAVMLLYQWWR